MPKRNKKISFVITPIGEPDSTIRKRADQILKHIIGPVVSELGYEPLRADKISKPGIITSQIINHILNDPLVIADLTGHNPNVFYELAVRHTVKKPVIQIIQDGEIIPFDVVTTRTIKINHQDLDSVDKAKKELKKQIEAVEEDPSLVDSPISMAVNLQTLKQSSDPESKTIADLKYAIQEINQVVREIQHQTRTIIPEPKKMVRVRTLSGDKAYSVVDGKLYEIVDKGFVRYMREIKEQNIDFDLDAYRKQKTKNKKQKTKKYDS